MKKYINYIKESKEEENEKTFIDATHLDELEIKFNFIKNQIYIYYFYNKIELFDYNKKHGKFRLNYVEIWEFLEHYMNYEDVQITTNNILKKIFKIKDIKLHNISTIIDIYKLT